MVFFREYKGGPKYKYEMVIRIKELLRKDVGKKKKEKRNIAAVAVKSLFLKPSPYMRTFSWDIVFKIV